MTIIWQIRPVKRLKLHLGMRAWGLLFVLLFLSMGNLRAQLFSGLRDSWREHTQSDPLTLSGTLGGGISSAWNNKDVLAYVTPFSATGYVDLTFNIYGFSFPFHLDLVNISQSQFTFPHPTFNINTTPTIGKFRFHLGSSSMHFSNYNYSGVTFTGAGVEYNGKWFRAAGFYGTLTRATKFSPSNHFAATLDLKAKADKKKHTIVLSWEIGYDGRKDYYGVIYRSTDGGNIFDDVATFSRGESSWADAGVAEGTTCHYYIELRLLDGGGISNPSKTVSAKLK